MISSQFLKWNLSKITYIFLHFTRFSSPTRQSIKILIDRSISHLFHKIIKGIAREKELIEYRWKTYEIRAKTFFNPCWTSDGVTTFDSSSIHLSIRFIKIKQWHLVLSNSFFRPPRRWRHGEERRHSPGWNVDSSDFLSSSPFLCPGAEKSDIFRLSHCGPLVFLPSALAPDDFLYARSSLYFTDGSLGSVTKSRVYDWNLWILSFHEQWTLLWPTRGAKFKRLALLFTAVDTEWRRC